MVDLPIVAISMGEPGGIGPEIILKSFQDNKLFTFCRPIVIGSAYVFEYYKKKISSPIVIEKLVDLPASPGNCSGKLPVLSVIEPNEITIGKHTLEGGIAAAESIKKAVSLALKGKVDAITTGPISKEGLNLAGYKYAGHTEMLADLTGTDNVAMMLVGGNLKVVMATTHLALKNVALSISKSKIELLLKIINENMASFGIRAPKIAVTSLNPHNGEGGLFGNEENDIISPAIKKVREDGINAYGPFPSDTLFIAEKRKDYDVILVMYHDQGLIPLKMIAFGKSVNITLGLSIIRTSVDHGTAYDIAGENIADPSSLIEALKTASTMVLNRK